MQPQQPNNEDLINPNQFVFSTPQMDEDGKVLMQQYQDRQRVFGELVKRYKTVIEFNS